MPEHNNRPWLKVAEIPAGRKIHDFIDREDAL
jgi:hypothetical protein